MLKRYIAAALVQRLRHNPVVALFGPRQVGKTTLAVSLNQIRSSVYLDLESPQDILKLSDPLAFLSESGRQLIILDEIQRMPELFPIIRGIVDKNRRTGRKGNQFLILGSASMALINQSSESLAGRISYLEVSGFSSLEVKSTTTKQLQKLRLRGGFPDSYLAKSNALSSEWRESFIRTYLERDLPQMGFRIPGIRLRRLWTMLAHLQGETINASSLAGSLGVDSKTIAYYIDILENLLLIRRLAPWYSNTKKRLVKSPRVYIRDSGILHTLLGINSEEDLLSHPVNGKSWEGFVLENLLSVLPVGCTPYFYRTVTGVEIDLLLKFSNKKVWAIEIKNGLAPKLKASFHQASKDVKATEKFVVYSGTEIFSIAQDTKVVSLPYLMRKLKA